MFSQLYDRTIDKIGEWNPQLFREIQGRLKPKTFAIVASASAFGQFLLYSYFKGMLPIREGNYDRYCLGAIDEKQYYYQGGGICQSDLLGNIQIFKELWWLDLFTAMSIMGVFILLVVGCYMLIADVSKENSRNTLNFIRLTPQSAITIFTGKMLGVPILVYLFGICAIPLHLIAGLKANISFPLIFGFYGILAVACVFFYTLSLLFSLVATGLGNLQAGLGGVAIFFFLSITSSVYMNANTFSYTSFDWLLLFNPIIFLTYLAKSTFISENAINYFAYGTVNELSWYGNFGWRNSLSAFLLIVANYGIWSFWLWQGVKRRFHNPNETVISKYHSYLMSACFIVFNVGFTLQENNYFGNEGKLVILQIFNFFFFLLLIPAITPHRQNLQDWARYRHENSLSKQQILKDLLLGEKSPAPMSIVLNVLILTVYLIPSLFFFSHQEQVFSNLLGFIFSGSIIMIYGTIFQLLLTIKNQKRSIIASSIVLSLIISPFLTLTILGATTHQFPVIWLFSAFPIAAFNFMSLDSIAILGSLLSQIIVILGFNYQLKRILDQAGISETKALMV